MIEKLFAAMGIDPKAIVEQVEAFQKYLVDFGTMFQQTSVHFDKKLSGMDERLARIENALGIEKPMNGHALLAHDPVEKGDNHD